MSLKQRVECIFTFRVTDMHSAYCMVLACREFSPQNTHSGTLRISPQKPPHHVEFARHPNLRRFGFEPIMYSSTVILLWLFFIVLGEARALHRYRAG